MKKFNLFFASLLLTATVSFSQFSINAGIGKDFYTIPAVENNYFTLWDGTPALLDREEISNPLYFNLQLEYKSGNFLYGLHLAGAYQKYKFSYSYFTLPALLSGEEKTEDEVPWARAEINAIVLYEIEIGGGLSVLLGGGGGLQIMPPIVSEKFIFETTLNKLLTFDFSDDIEMEYLPNGKAVARLKYQITNTFSLAAEADYLFVSAGKYEQPSSFVNAAVFAGVRF
jgi:hypothetical protein